MWYTAPHIRVFYTQAFQTQSKQTRPAASYAQSIAISKQLQQTMPLRTDKVCGKSERVCPEHCNLKSSHYTAPHSQLSRLCSMLHPNRPYLCLLMYLNPCSQQIRLHGKLYPDNFGSKPIEIYDLDTGKHLLRRQPRLH